MKTKAQTSTLMMRIKFRRTFAGLHHDSGVPMRTLQDWLGHADLATTQMYLAAADVRSTKTRVAVNRSFEAFV